MNKGHITAFLNELCVKAYTTAKQARIILKTSLRYAVSKKLIVENPAENILLPKNPKAQNGEYRTIKIKREQTLSVEQLKLLFDKSKDTKIYLHLMFASLMGLRKGEIRGLKYSDIDYARQTIHVQRQLGKDLSKDQSKLPPKTITKQEISLKTRSSDRILDIPDVVFNAILEERKRYEANRRRRPNDFQDNDYICCSSYGRPRSATFASQKYKQLLRENNLPDIRFHDLRHTYASMLLGEEIDVKAISNSLGHAKSIISVDVYGDNQSIIADGAMEIQPFIDEILPSDYLERMRKGSARNEELPDKRVCFPEELANEIMCCLLNKSA